MALNKRTQWMVKKVTEAFAIESDETTRVFSDSVKCVDAFLDDIDSPPRLFFFYQPRQTPEPELFLSLGQEEKLGGKCVYFLRDSAKPIKTAVDNDDTVIFGELHADILQSFEGTLSQVFSPLLEKQPHWGNLEADADKTPFLENTNKFVDNIRKKIENLRGEVELRTPEPPFDKIEQKPVAYTEAAKDPETLRHFQSIVKSWCEVITKYMEDDPSNTPIEKNNDSGPEVEIECWSRRMLTLISITEQLKSKPNRVVTGTLKARALSEEPEEGADGQPSEREKTKILIEQWREVDLAITDALNEAKDNVRFLENLRKVIEPLYTESPLAIADTMPSLMNSMKMIHTLSRHYGTEVRMTNLFFRITNQLITRCKEDIYGGKTSRSSALNYLWEQDPAIVIQKMQAAIRLCEEYRAHYKDTKQKLATMPTGKHFNFDDNLIFGKFTRFRRRLEKLIDMFSSVKQFRALEEKKIDGMDKLISSFQNLIQDFKLKAHDLLDFNNTVFERDFVEFTMHNSGLENAIQDFMKRTLTQMHSIDKQLELMNKFKEVLSRDALRDDLDHKYHMVFLQYGKNLANISQTYDRYKENPPLPRNMTEIAGKIHWSRQLLRRITSPMRKFQENPKVFHTKDSKKIVSNYNKLARTLIVYETQFFQGWQASTDAAKRGLRSRLIVANPQTGKLVVNFDHGVLALMREAKHLQLMGFEIPNSAKIVLLLEDKLKNYYNEISHALEIYNRMTAAVSPVTKSLLKPHLKDLENTIRPAMTTMTWTSMNIEHFLHNLHQVLGRFEFLVSQINDIVDNRVQKNLTFVGSLLMLNLPNDRTFTVRDFVNEQRAHMETCTEHLVAKNVEIERAVNDLVDAVMSYPLGPNITPTSQIDINFVKLHFCHLMYHALLSATRTSLHRLKKRLQNPVGSETVPLFELDVSLQVPAVSLSPSLQEVQDAICLVAREALQSTKKLIDWGIDATARSRNRKPFYEKLAADKNLAIVLLLLTGTVEETKKVANTDLAQFDEFSWLWTKDPETEYASFMALGNRILEDFIAELHKFVKVEEKVAVITETQDVGSLILRTTNLKEQFKHEIDRWKHQYSEKLHQEAKSDMEATTELMHDLKTKLEREVRDFASLKSVMDAQAEVRDIQSWIDMKFNSIIERYNTLEKYLPFGVMTKDEMDAKSILRTQWTAILNDSEAVMKVVNKLQSGFKQDLIVNVREFRTSVTNFREEYETQGPMVPGTKPMEAITRLNKYKREFDTLNRKYELYNGGEKLFGLQEMKYPALVTTKKELQLLDKLYSLYQDVISTVDEYKSIPWAEVVANIQEMNDTVEQFQNQCRRMPKTLRGWEAYVELSQTIDDFIEVLPMLTELSKPAMRPRHWEEISELTGQEFDYEKFAELKLKTVLEAKLLEFREDIEEITDGAEKQLGIEEKLREIEKHWEVAGFEFSAWKERGDVILAGLSVAEITEQLEESTAGLQQMLTQKHVTPFKEECMQWWKKLGDVNDTLEGWVKVQLLWMSLEAVFTGGDIARQMPQDTRVFMKVDKEWTQRLMTKAKDVKNVVEACQNEYIKNMLPTMFSDLEKCQKALDGYLEAKRAKFPRFYFVSNPALLLILSQGSDKEAVQQCFAKIFDSIDRVEFQGNNITKMITLKAGFDGVMDSEDIPLTKSVAAKGNIEDWLALMLVEMQRTVKDIVRAGAGEFEAMPMPEFIEKYCAQVSLLGIQFMWTSDVQEALIRASKNDKTALAGAQNKQGRVLTELSSMTTQDIKTKLERTKIETLVTIQVHQKDVLDVMVKRKTKDAYDFEWQKQLRCYWIPEDDDCVVKIADVDFVYCYEYLGCKERLVVTPLTDRCYISLSQAMGMCFGGAPAGPAGTGKTETVKDLGRALGKIVVVFNCSDQMHTADTAKIYKGLCQSGAWGCFDEFNRIDLEVLSVVAQQVQAVLTAMRAQTDKFTFPGDDIGEVTLDARCGFFITMNPGYAGRQELPENLKALFRGVAMMVPDREIIIKVKLASVGYNDFKPLSKKFRVLYNLCEEQLSKQRHYDFGLRNILSVLRTAGVNLRIELGKDAQQDRSNLEEMLMMRTLRDMNLSKLVRDDVGLFISLLHDLFPNQKDPEKRRYDQEEEAMRKVIEKFKIIHHDDWVNKVIQLYETSLVRHGLMMVGPAGGGKTVATRVLIEALTMSHDKHLMVVMNPKAIEAEEMFGMNDLISGEWTHGIFSSIWHKYNDVKKPNTWIVCDGPVDAIWIENLNTVLDDNKLLTLANGDRIPMTDNVRLLFEVENLRNASPATVSRAGIIFVSSADLGHDPVVQAWLKSRPERESEILEQLYQKIVVQPELLDWLMRNTRNVMTVSRVHVMTNTLALMEALLKPKMEDDNEITEEQYERLFLYCVCWSLGGLLEADDRKKMSDFMGKLTQCMPPMEATGDIFQFYVHEETMEWTFWQASVWEFERETFKYTTCLVPTVDSVRAEYIIDVLLTRLEKPVLVCGSSGTAKTSLVLQYTRGYDASKMLLKKSNFSSATTPGMFQVSMEADIEKRQGKTYAPSGNRWMTVFLDDISMPEVNPWGDQPTLEVVRQLVETGGFYFLEKDKRGDKMNVENVMYVAAMSHPGGGRNDIPKRLCRHFFAFNLPPPSQFSIDNIYGSMLRGMYEEREDLQPLIPKLTAGTIDLWNRVKGKMLPTPSKFHYSFNMRELSRVFQGVLFSPLDVVTGPDYVMALWKHECERVFSDKLVNEKDKGWYQEAVLSVMTQHFGAEVAEQFGAADNPPVYFVDYLRDPVIDEETDEILEDAPKIYEIVPDVAAMKERVETRLAEFNAEPTNKRMDLVLFEDALQHMMRISRIIGMPRGNALLVGVGGSGRQSLTRLAAAIAGQEVFQIQLTRSYKMADFLDDIRKLYTWVGKEGKSVTWVFTDFEILDEEFLEYINAILATGEVAGLFPKDERDMMCSDLRGPAKKEDPNFDDTPDNLYRYFIDRIRDNLHIVLAFSPANTKFAERARRFPGLISGCTIDWFLRWPQQALEEVSQKFLTADPDFKVETDPETESAIVKHIAHVHDMVTSACEDYFTAFRRAVYVTPKSYLSFIQAYKQTYTQKLAEIVIKASNVATGLSKLKDAEVDVDKMKGELEKQNVKLAVADRNATAMLAKVEVGSKEAGIKKGKAQVIETECTATAEAIEAEKAAADVELQAAMPFVHAAMDAAKSITKPDIGQIQRFGKPPDLIKRIMDCVLILNHQPLEKVMLMEIKVEKDMQIFIADSYDTFAKKYMVSAEFIPTLMKFAEQEKDNINEETMELLMPYLNVPDFNAKRAKSVASAAEGLCKWVRAMFDYHKAALIVGPKLEQLKIKSAELDAAMKKLNQAKADSAAAQAEVDKLQETFDNTVAEKARLEQEATETQNKMTAANNLITSLGGEKKRWNADALIFADSKKKLIGDCALACAFVSYLGPFNSEFRKKLLEDYFYKDCSDNAIPVSENLDVNKFLVDDGTIAEWNSQGLPKDELSIQNGILVTQASRYPLLVDPQGQALSWLKKREAENFPVWGTTTLSNSKLRDQLEFCMEEGKPLLVEGVVKEVDPMFDPVLEKNVVAKGRGFYIMLGDKAVTLEANFRLYLITKLSNPLFSPELSAKTTIIDFSVTQKGLEDQLLSRVIQQEQKSLEEQRQKLIEEVNMNTISLQDLDKQLLERLSASSGNLLDDVELIAVLSNTKTKAQEVKEKIEASVVTEQIINKKREQYRPVATRGSSIYFVIVSLAAVNCMYQISLAQFLHWFDKTLAQAEKANLVAKRVEILMEHLTFNVYLNVDRGLFEVDKIVYKLMMTMKILVTETDELNNDMVTLLLRGGASLSLDQVPPNPFRWLQQSAWMNICALSISMDFFRDLKSTLTQSEDEFRTWYEAEAPEEEDIPKIQDRLDSHPAGAFMRMLLIRSFRDDRTRLAANQFIGKRLGKKYIDPIQLRFEDVWADSDIMTPVILLLTPGADPTSQLEELAKKKSLKIYAVSMGEGQEPHAAKCIDNGMNEGGWALLQNCHLGLGFMGHLDEDLLKAQEEREIDPAFRTWITCEPHPEFPINLLQMSIKVTNEPPAGMKAGLFRSYTSVVDDERLARVDLKQWRDLVFCLCFMHSAVQERRKFGPTGWCIPYEFNTSDLEASLTFLEKHLFNSQGLSWPTIQYMICEVQYGGRITDDYDRILFNTFGDLWLCPNVFEEDFTFTNVKGHFQYVVPSFDQVGDYLKFISDVPAHDSPEIFGLHGNADLTFGTNEANYILNTISDTQPKQSSTAGGGKTREETVHEKAGELLAQMPPDYKDDEVRSMVSKRKKDELEFVLGETGVGKVEGFSIPLNVFLYQEICRLQFTIANVRATLTELQQAIDGEIIMTAQLQQALDAVYDGKPPMHWYKDASGAEIAWDLPALALWFQGLLDRDKQLNSWLITTRPITYWLTGFFNPQGFLTAMKQEVTRRHKAEKWALDDVVVTSEVTDFMNPTRVKAPPKEGVLIHGLFLEGATWDAKEKSLIDPVPKELYSGLPVVKVTANTSSRAKAQYSGATYYDCPVYTKPRRTDLNYVFDLKLPTKSPFNHASHWVMRGLAALCSKE